MKMRDFLEVKNGVGEFRPCGETSLVEAVGLITQAITYCRVERIEKLLVVTTGLTGVSIPTLVDRFLMVEDWAREAKGTLAAAMVANPQYVHPQKFGVQVAAEFGFVVDVFTSEPDAREWLENYKQPE
jgi:hypothetical protein